MYCLGKHEQRELKLSSVSRRARLTGSRNLPDEEFPFWALGLSSALEILSQLEPT
jgi:hypothetical protein